MISALITGFAPPAIFSVLLTQLGYNGLDWLAPVCGSIWVFIIGYSILRYRQMDVRAVIAEVLAIALTALFFINIFIAVTPNLTLRIATFLVSIVISVYLVRSILRESKQKEEIEHLNKLLNAKVLAQTVEIQKAYELEKKARRDLEKLNETKDQFIMITQHHIRSPLRSIIAGLKKVSGDGVAEIKESTSRLTRIVDDFLSISGLKTGGQILKLEKTSLKPLIDDVLKELAVDIRGKKIGVSYDPSEEVWPPVHVDAYKMREALLIILENAVKYNVEGGTILISQAAAGKKFEMRVINTGIGIKTDDQKKIFDNLFYRSEKAKDANPIGMGVGLSVARAIIRAHHGDLTLHSDGENRGAIVEISLPI